MTAGNEREGAIKQLEEALRAENCDEKNFHIREAIQYLRIADKAAPANADSANEIRR